MDDLDAKSCLSFFDEDTFDEDDELFERCQKQTSRSFFDISGWRDTISPQWPILENFKFPLAGKSFASYYSDKSPSFLEIKEILRIELCKWIEQDISNFEFTICDSVTIASMALLLALKESGINLVYFETPCFYAPYYQAIELGMQAVLIPTFLEDEFELSIDKFVKEMPDNSILWIFQPRYCLGKNTSNEQIEALGARLGKNSYLVIDEATDFSYPAFLNVPCNSNREKIIRIRSFFKATGINGIRTAAIVHPYSMKKRLENTFEIIQGGLSFPSHAMTSEIVKKNEILQLMLSEGQKLVFENYKLLDNLAFGSSIKLHVLENGYYGCGHISKPIGSAESLEDFRKRILAFCLLNGVRILTGNNWLLARNDNAIFFRINYYKSFFELSEGLQRLMRFIP